MTTTRTPRPRLSRTPSGPSRRALLGASVPLSMAALLGACTGGGGSAEESPRAKDGILRWWDQFRPLTETFENELFAPYTEESSDLTIERRQLDAADLGEALQVARRSGQMPDVHSNAGLGATPAALISQDWFQPIGDHIDVESLPVAEEIYDGVHRFGGDLYSVPMFSGRIHDATPWVNTELAEQAGVDPDSSPGTWDEFRAAAKQITDETVASGFVLPQKDTQFLDGFVSWIAQSAGAPGGIDWTTGEYQFATRPFVDAIEFLKSFQDDGIMHPSSPSMGPRDARARWAAGEIGIYMWGSWIIGGLSVDEPESIERGIQAWSIPRQDSTRHMLTRGPGAGQFWVAADSPYAQEAAELLAAMCGEEFQAALAGAMDQPPALLSAVEGADVHPAYTRMVEHFTEDVRIAPVPESGNPATWRVVAEMTDIHPNVGEIAQSYLSGATDDLQGELTAYYDAMNAERERAVESVAAQGEDVGLEDWVFSNWDRSADYTADDYASR
ncbi:ABC transporter substrate-binding protein [Brachybacterium sp. AOP43-C2-M15]|uniref:ABC transporter substrate-binding protein n=1 Tax=Brachybacterium sp. AOP43-C2-M15 TaxID=3457661 RepID=UPI004033D16A